MPDSDAVSKTVSTLQSAYNLAKGIADLNEAHAIKVQIGELQAQILSAQESALRSQERETALTRQVHEIEQHIAHMEKWESEKERYDLTEITDGVFAFVLKEPERGSGPAHCMCANCFNEGHPVILQTETRQPYHTKFMICHRCGSEIVTEGMRLPEHSQPPRRRR